MKQGSRFVADRRRMGCRGGKFISCCAGGALLLLFAAGGIFQGRSQPAIVQNPQSQTVMPGTIVNLSVEAEGTAPLRYRWKHNGHYMTSHKPYVRFVARSRRAGTYLAMVRDASKQWTTSTVATINVQTIPLAGHAAPVILAQPQDTTVHEHDTAVFTVKLNNSAPYTTIVWHNDNPLEGPHQIPDGIGLNVHNPTLVIPNALDVNYFNGIYWLAVTNAAGGTVSRKAVLTVTRP